MRPKGADLIIHSQVTPQRKRLVHIDRLRSLVATALSRGGVRVSQFRTRWDIAGPCERPYVTEIYARPSAPGLNVRSFVTVKRGSEHPLVLELHTPCRGCEKCNRKRQNLWTARISAETRASTRTWVGTLTLRPEAYYRALVECRHKEGLQGVDFDALPERERLALIHANVAREVTKMLKRIRKGHKAPLRHFVALELHKSGVPHYHLLIHENSAEVPLRHRAIAEQWPLGFSKWKLADTVAGATYVSKYLSKSLLARVRASKAYGQVDNLANVTSLPDR